jgi:hypothetical protein
MAYRPMLSDEQKKHIRELLQQRNELSKERRQIETEISRIEQEIENRPLHQKAWSGIRDFSKQLYNGNYKRDDIGLSGLRRRLRDVEGQIEVDDTILRTPANKNLQAGYHHDVNTEKKWMREMEKKERKNDDMPDSDDEYNFGFKAKRKSTKRKSTKGTSTKRKSPRRKSTKRKSISRKKSVDYIYKKSIKK